MVGVDEVDSYSYAILRPAFSSSVAGACIITLTLTPLDVVKNYWYYNKALSSIRTRVNSLYVVKHLYQSRGFRAFWSGSVWTSLSIISGQILFLWIFESLKQSHNLFYSSVCSRTAALMFATPFDCLKTWSQANMFDKNNINQLKLSNLSNFTRLYSGFFPTLIRDIPYSVVHWPCYEFLNKKSKQLFPIDDKFYILKNVALPLVCGTISSFFAVLISQPFDIMKTNIQAKISNPKSPESGKLSSYCKELFNIYSKGGIKGFGIGIMPRVARVVPASAIMVSAYEYFKNSPI